MEIFIKLILISLFASRNLLPLGKHFSYISNNCGLLWSRQPVIGRAVKFLILNRPYCLLETIPNCSMCMPDILFPEFFFCILLTHSIVPF